MPQTRTSRNQKMEYSLSRKCGLVYRGQPCNGRPNMELFIERHAAKIVGELSCLGWIVVSCTIPGICYADGMSGYLRLKGIRIVEYAFRPSRCVTKFAETPNAWPKRPR